MTKRSTTEDFIKKAATKHGTAYNYNKVIYTTNSVKVEIHCNKHNSVFMQSPAKHLAGQGCPICRYEKSSAAITKTTSDFIESAVKVHGDNYSYCDTSYVNAFEPVTIFCKTHKLHFEQKPTNHLSGNGCPLCSAEKIKANSQNLALSTDEFISKAVSVHGDLYDYSNTVYTRSASLVNIWCNRHQGLFKQTPNNHLAGIGCASCAKTGYSTNKGGLLYILSCGDITKVGITNVSASHRASKISKSYGAEFSVVKVLEFEDGTIPDAVETRILQVLRSKYERPQARFEGSSECFLSVDHEWLFAEIESEIERQQGVLIGH